MEINNDFVMIVMIMTYEISHNLYSVYICNIYSK